jgi:predicted RNase H-like HicB family nuclease
MGAGKTLRLLLSGASDAALRFDDLCQLLESLGFEVRVRGSHHLFGFQTMTKYEVIIYWSDEDEAFIAEAPQLPGCMAHGISQEAALANAQDAIRLWIDTAREFGDPIPEPKGRRLILA